MDDQMNTEVYEDDHGQGQVLREIQFCNLDPSSLKEYLISRNISEEAARVLEGLCFKQFVF